MGIFAWIILGAIAGWLGNAVMGSKGGLLRNILLGIVGAFVGGFVMNLIGGKGISEFSLYSILVAALGAIIVIFLARKFRS